MQPPLTVATVRVPPDLIRTVDRLAQHPDALSHGNRPRPSQRPNTRSDVLRLAIRIGLDVLTETPALKL